MKSAIDKILSIFETGKLPTKEAYSTCTILKDGAGISYGMHQATDKSGSLDKILSEYIKNGGVYADKLKEFQVKLSNNETTLSGSLQQLWVLDLIKTLKLAGADPIMQSAQDKIFNDLYWEPAVERANACKLNMPISFLTLYDTSIHSGPAGIEKIRSMFPQFPPSKGGDEKEWVLAYINARKNYLLSSSNQLVRNSSYRIDEIKNLYDSKNFELKLPITIRGVKIT